MSKVKEKSVEIRNWIENIFDPFNLKHRHAMMRAIRLIFEYQTMTEKQTEQTQLWNNVGFNGADAPFLSSLAKQSYPLTVKQASRAAKQMKKYSGQLAKIKLGVQ